MSIAPRTSPLVLAALAVVLAVALAGSPAHRAHAQTPDSEVAMYPIGSTETANPHTTISFRGSTHIKNLTVTGSTTGRHSGHFKTHSDGQGVSFIPDDDFAEGETVTVHSSTPLKRADSSGNVRFQIYTRPDEKYLKNIHRFHGDPEGNPSAADHFYSRTDLRPPGLKITKSDPSASDDPLFFAVKGGPGQDGPEIRDALGRLIWFHRVRPPYSPYDFRTQAYDGRPVLTWWEGKVLAGKGIGHGEIYDSSYHEIKQVRASNGFHMDQHEFEITPRGTAFINVYNPVKFSLKPIGGPKDGAAWDSIVQEIDIKTGLVLFEWHSLAHVSVKLGTFPLRDNGTPYDPFHVNSVSEDGDGNLLLSARNTNALFFIDRKGGKVLARIGGKKSDYEMGEGTNMVGQHHAVLQPDGTISVFDNGGSTQYPTVPDKESRGIFLRLDPNARTATLVHEYTHSPEHLFSRSQGSMQVTGNDDVFISWGGGNPFLTEFNREGDTVFDSHFTPSKVDTYRAYRLPWSHARAENDPDAAAFSDDTGTDVYVSWNGATDVARWVVYSGKSSPDSLKRRADAPWEGFETHIRLPGHPKYVRVDALDADGHLLDSTKTITPKRV